VKWIDRLCAGMLFLLAVVICLLVPKNYTGRIWIFGTGLALLFTAMMNWLRLRNGYAVRSLRMFCIACNVIMLVLAGALIASIGEQRTLGNPEVPFTGMLLLVECAFSLGKNAARDGQ
jgi:hypothetical protein